MQTCTCKKIVFIRFHCIGHMMKIKISLLKKFEKDYDDDSTRIYPGVCLKLLNLTRDCQ